LSYLEQKQIFELLIVNKETIIKRASAAKQIKVKNRNIEKNNKLEHLDIKRKEVTKYYLNLFNNGAYEISYRPIIEFTFSIEVKELDTHLIICLDKKGYIFKIELNKLIGNSGNLLVETPFFKDFNLIKNIFVVNNHHKALVILINKAESFYFKVNDLQMIPQIKAESKMEDYQFIGIIYDNINYLIISNNQIKDFEGLIHISRKSDLKKLTDYPNIKKFLNLKGLKID